MPRPYTTEEFIEKAKAKHLKNPYNYNFTKYTGSKNKILFLCLKHKIFHYQEAASHLRGSGCPRCAIEKRTEAVKKLWKEEKERRRKLQEQKQLKLKFN